MQSSNLSNVQSDMTAWSRQTFSYIFKTNNNLIRMQSSKRLETHFEYYVRADRNKSLGRSTYYPVHMVPPHCPEQFDLSFVQEAVNNCEFLKAPETHNMIRTIRA